MCFVVYMCLIFLIFPILLELFPLEKNAQIYVYIRETRRRRRWVFFVISVSFERERADFAKRFLLMSFSSDERTINRCRRTSSGAKRNTTVNSQRGGDHLHDLLPGERESGRV